MNPEIKNQNHLSTEQEKILWDASQRLAEREKIKIEQKVIISGIDISFIDLIIFIVKFAIAAIPAAIILIIVGWIIKAVMFNLLLR